MKNWVWVLAIADQSGDPLVDVYQNQPQAQSAFRKALKEYGGNRRYDVRLAFVKSLDRFLVSHPEYSPAL